MPTSIKKKPIWMKNPPPSEGMPFQPRYVTPSATPIYYPEPEEVEETLTLPEAAWETHNNSPAMKRALRDNPLSLIPPESREAALKVFQVAGYDESALEETVLRAVAVRYLANQYRLPYHEVDLGWDEVTKQVFGKKMSGREVYFFLRDLQKREDAEAEHSFGARAGGHLAAGLGDVSGGLYAAAGGVVGGFEVAGHLLSGAVFGPLEYLARRAGWERAAEFARKENYFTRTAAEDARRVDPLAAAREFLETKAREQKNFAAYYEQQGGKSTGFTEDVTLGVIRNLPQLLLTVAAAGAGMGAAVTPVFGMTAGANEFLETRDNPNMSYAGQVLNAVAVGTAEWFFEQELGAGRIIRKYWTQTLGPAEIKKISDGIMASTLRTARGLAIDAAGEGLEEVATGITQRLSNLLSGKTGKDLAAMSRMEIARELLDPAALEFTTGAALGMLGGGAGVKARYQQAKYDARMLKFRADVFGMANARIAQIENLESPTAAQCREAEQLRSSVAERNADAIVAHFLHNGPEIAETGENASATDDETDELTTRQYAEQVSLAAIREIRDRQAAEQTDAEARFTALQTLFQQGLRRLNLPGLDVQLVRSTADLPDDLSVRPDAEGVFDPAGNRIYLVGENLSAGRVQKVLLHEIAGHLGLRRILGEDFDAFILRTADEHADAVAAIANERALDLTDPAQRREAAEEFLARLAEQPDNSLWGRIAAALRRLLRTLGWNGAWSDAELRDLIRRGLRNLRRGSAGANAASGDTDGARMAINQNFNAELEQQVVGSLRPEHIYQLGTPSNILLSTGVPNLPIELSANRLKEKSEARHHTFDIGDMKDLPVALESPIGVFAYGDKTKAQNIIVEIQKDGKYFIVGLSLNFKHDGLVVNSIRGLFPKNTHEWMTWIQNGKALYLNKKKIQKLIGQQRTNLADVAYLDLDSILNIVENFENPSLENQKSQKNSDTRFSIEPVGEGAPGRTDFAKAELWAKALLPTVRTSFVNPDAAAAFLMDRGVRIDAERDESTLQAACALARDMIRERNAKVRKRAETSEIARKDDFFKVIAAQYGPDFKINPGPKYDGTTFTGSWMDKHKREKSRRNAGAIPAEDAAKLLTEKLGREISPALVVEHFSHLQRETLLADLREKRRRKNDLRSIEDEIMEEERMAATGDDFGGDRPFPETSPSLEEARKRFVRQEAKARKMRMDKWVQENLGALYQHVVEFTGSNILIRPSARFIGLDFSGSFIAPEFRTYSEERPGKRTGKALLDYRARRQNALDSATGYPSDALAREIANKYGGDENTIEHEIIELFRHLKRSDLKAMYRDAMRETREYEQYTARKDDAEAVALRFQELLDAAREDKLSIIRFQSRAVQYAKRFLPEEARGAFLREIADLARFDREPSVKYPHGRRAYEMEKLLRNMQNFRVAQRIRDLLDGTRVRVRNGRPVGNFGENTENINKIRDIVAMPAIDVENRLLDLREKIAAADNDPEGDGSAADALRVELALYDTFGNLDNKTPDQNLAALRTLRDLIDGDRTSMLNRLFALRQQLGKDRLAAVREIGGITPTGRIETEPPQPAKFTLEQLNLRSLLELISSRSGKNFDDTVFGGLFAKLEQCTQHKATMDRENNEEALRSLGNIFGFRDEHTGKISLREQARFWRDADTVPEHTGIMLKRYSRELVYYYDDAGNAVSQGEMRRGLKRTKISVKNARELLKNIDSGKIKNIEPLAAEFLRQQLSDFDLKIERQYHLFGNEDQDGTFQLLISPEGRKGDAESRTDLLLIDHDPNESVTTTELLVSKAEAATLLLAWEQPDVQARMRWNGWDDTTIDQLKSYLGPQYIRCAYWARDAVARLAPQLDALTKRIYGAGLPMLVNYFPTSYHENLGRTIGETAADGGTMPDGYGQLSVNPAFLIARRFHLAEPDLHQNVFASLFRHQQEVTHFLAFGEAIRDFRGIFNSRPVREAISAAYGTEVYNQIRHRVTVIADGGAKTGRLGQLMGRLFRYWVPAKLAFNLSSVAKQIAGVTQYMNDIPMGDFLANWAESYAQSDLYRRFAQWAKNSDYLKNRAAGGLNRDLLALRSGRAAHLDDVLGNWLIDQGMTWTAKADLISAVHGGYAVFKYHYEQALSRGVGESEAWDFAAQKWMRATDETQQSGYLKDQNFFQSQANMYRYLTAFLSNPIQVMNLELQTVNRLRFGSDPAARTKLARQIVVNHLVTPALMTAITQFMRAGFDWDDWDWSDFLTAFLLGPFNGWIFLGKIAEMGMDRLNALATGKKKSPFGASAFSAQPLLDDLLAGADRFARTMQKLFGDKPLTARDVYGGIQSFADVATASGGIPLNFFSTVGSTGAVAAAALREIRRWWKKLPDSPWDDDRKRR